MREKKAELASFVLIGVMLASIFAGAVSGAGVGGAEEGIDYPIVSNLKAQSADFRSPECVDFEDPPLGTTFHVGDIFTDSGATITVQSFQWSNSKWTTDGYAVIENKGLVGGSGQEIGVNNVNLDFDFGSPCSGISLLFGEYGGNLNIEINGDFRNFEDFVDINGATIGGVNVLVVNGFGNDKGSLKLSGTINSFIIGGQELWIDDVCSGIITSPECVDFEDPPLGTTFHVGDIFTDSGATITVQSFQWSNSKWTTDGYAVIENKGLAGGSGQEIGVNNVNLDFDFGSPCSGISLLFGEYGGNLNIEINGDFRNFEDFVDINGATIGGVNVLVVNGFGNDKGSLKLSGTINSLVIGGQELWIDDVCPGAPGEMPDLIVTITGPDRAIAGGIIDFEVIVRNVGSATAPGSLDVEYWKAYYVDLILSSDSNIPLKLAVRPAYAEDFVEDMLLKGGRISRTVSIPPGGYANYTLNQYIPIPKNASPGIYCLGAVVDPAKAVYELNEDNNTFCHKINILPPEMAPTEPPAGVDFYVMPYAVGGTPLYNIKDSGLTDYTDIVDAPFGGRLGFSHAYDSRIPTKEIMYYRWLYKDESETEWHEFTETVGVHYEKKELGVLTFPVYTLGPKGVNGMNLYEFKPHSPPESGTSWPATDGFGDIYSGFLNSEAISDGKYEIKLEIYDKIGNQVIPADSTFKFIVPTGVDANGTILTSNATSGEIDNKTGGFVFSLHIDNRKCSAVIDAPSIGTTSMADECGFLRYTPADETVHIAFHATHPDNFAIFTFSIIRGTKEIISANGEVSAYSVGDFSGDGNGNFENESSRSKLLEECAEAAFSENLYVYAKATTGWGHRINGYDAHAVRAFALSPI